MLSRRKFLHLSASLGLVAGFNKLALLQAAPVPDYKALVCVFLFGVTMDTTWLSLSIVRSTARIKAPVAPWRCLRGSCSASPIRSLGLRPALCCPELQALFNRGKLAILANVGVLVQPTAYSDLANPSFQLPMNLRSHADQVILMQTGYPNSGGSSGWAADTRSTTDVQRQYQFPHRHRHEQPSDLLCRRSDTRSQFATGELPGPERLRYLPAAAAQARATAQQQIVTAGSGNTIINAANKVMSSAITLIPCSNLRPAARYFPNPFPPLRSGISSKKLPASSA